MTPALSTPPPRKPALFPYPVSVAPMMKRTDRHFRYFMRGITKRTLLYTEMVTTGAILFGQRDKFLEFNEGEGPLALQLGGDCPKSLGECARIAEDYGYDEVNLNVGCPSDRVQNGNFGASLMARPEVVAEAVSQMQKAVSIPVTVKHRIGIDDMDSYEDMKRFVEIVADAGCTRFTVHARKAWLNGLNPKENRTIPPLRYNEVHRLKEEFPDLTIEINGGITTLNEVAHQLLQVDAVMLGRAAYDTPFLFSEVDRRFFGEDTPPVDRRTAVLRMLPYIEARRAEGVPLSRIARHLLNVFAGEYNGRLWRRYITEKASLPGAGTEVIEGALSLIH